MAEDFLVQGWCPGALRPMLSGDGYLVRIRISGGEISPDQAVAIADLSHRFGNGAIDLSARANMQLRGVPEHNLPPLWQALETMALLDDTEAQERIRNIMVAPLCGWDDSAKDMRPLAMALEHGLKAAGLHDLPAKFGFSLCGGGLLPLDHHADIGLVWVDDDIALLAGGITLGVCSEGSAVATALALAHRFLDTRGSHKRMAGWITGQDASALAQWLGLSPCPAMVLPPKPNPIGNHDIYSGFGVPFGRLEARQFAALAIAAKMPMRLTPWRALLVEGSDNDLMREAGALGFVIHADDPSLNVIACTGKPGCLQAKADMRALANILAPLVPKALAPLHLSGCAKGCAHHDAAPLTVTATGNGFDLILNGLARDEPFARAIPQSELAARLRLHYALLAETPS